MIGTLSDRALEVLELLTFGPLKEDAETGDVGEHVIVYSDPKCRTSSLAPNQLASALNYAGSGSFLDLTEAELAEHILRRKVQSAGVNYARHMSKGDRPAKRAARKRILKTFQPDVWRIPLRILTMPGLHWTFEKELLAMRKGRSTEIHAVENDPAIFRASRYFMPGRTQTENLSGLCANNATLASAFRRSECIEGYHFLNAETFMRECYPGEFNAAWFDFTGTLTKFRIKALRDFWHVCRPRVLAVTWLNCRFQQPAADWIAEFRRKGHGDAVDYLFAYLTDKKRGAPATLLDRHTYTDGFSAMAQLIIKS